MKKLTKPTIITIVVVAVLCVAFAITLPIYLKSLEDNRALYEDQKIRILLKDELIGEYTFAELEVLSPAVEFEATYKPNGLLPITRTYSGIFLRDLITALDIDLDTLTGVEFEASDGLHKVYTIADVLEDDNVYIANKVNGELFNKGICALSSTEPQEDGGPYVVIKAKDAVSQNRVKLLVEINFV